MNDLTVIGERSVADVSSQVAKIQDLMKKVMKDGEHFGVIPGTGDKPSLLKAGAEKLCFVFRLIPSFEITRDDLPNGHREYTITCTLKTMEGVFAGQGVGSCSTMESKYRYRNASDYEILDDPIPEDAKERKSEYRKQGFGMKKVDGVWLWVKYTSEGKVENPDIADVYNTVLKMAKKRSHVDATITATAASDIFTQDVEDMPEFDGRAPSSTPSQSKPAPVQGKPQPAASTSDVEGLILSAISSGKLSKKDADMWRGKMQNEGTRSAAEGYIRSTFGNLAPVKSAPMSAGKEAAIDVEELDAAADAGFDDPEIPGLY
jgi:hypothetical protein